MQEGRKAGRLDSVMAVKREPRRCPDDLASEVRVGQLFLPSSVVLYPARSRLPGVFMGKGGVVATQSGASLHHYLRDSGPARGREKLHGSSGATPMDLRWSIGNNTATLTHEYP